MTVTASALDWLLDSDEPGIVFQAKRDLLGEADPLRPPTSSRAEGTGAPRGAAVRRRVRRQRLRQVGRRALAARLAGRARRPGRRAPLRRRGRDRPRVADRQGHRSRIQTIDGLVRRCGSQEGNALAVCCRLGLAMTRASGCSRSRSSSGSGRTAAGTATRTRRATAPRSTSRCRRCGACTSTGSPPGRRRRRTQPSARRSSCSSTDCFARSRPASRSGPRSS